MLSNDTNDITHYYTCYCLFVDLSPPLAYELYKNRNGAFFSSFQLSPLGSHNHCYRIDIQLVVR